MEPTSQVEPVLPSGTRVRLVGKPIGVTVRTAVGRIARPDEYAGFYIVRLDEPAIYHRADGGTEELDEIREAGDNLQVLASASSAPVMTPDG